MKKIIFLPLVLHAHATEALIVIGFVYFILFFVGVFFLKWFYETLKDWKENGFRF